MGGFLWGVLFGVAVLGIAWQFRRRKRRRGRRNQPNRPRQPRQPSRARQFDFSDRYLYQNYQALKAPATTHAPADQLMLATQLIQMGNEREAQKIIRARLQADPRDIRAWYLAGHLHRNPAKKRRAFQHVLKFNPNHQGAQAELDKLMRRSPSP
jgi:hypothetical protein